MTENRDRMSRAARTARGLLATTVSTLFAAASHTVGGGSITALAIIATAALALPLCVALAGRVGSLWRLSVAVCASQFLYHWSFAGLGLIAPSATAGQTDGVGAAAVALGPHAAHFAAVLPGPAVDPASVAGAGILMWVSHAAAAAFTIVALHRGEHAWLALTRLLVRVILPRLRKITLIEPLAARPPAREPQALRLIERLLCSAAITHRGPPAIA